MGTPISKVTLRSAETVILKRLELNEWVVLVPGFKTGYHIISYVREDKVVETEIEVTRMDPSLLTLYMEAACLLDDQV